MTLLQNIFRFQRNHPSLTRRAPNVSCLAGLLLLCFTGCSGPTRTAGTSGMAAEDLAILSIPQLPEEVPMRIRTIQFDGDPETYEIGKGRDFYLLPRDRTASFTFSGHVPGIGGTFIPKDALTLPGPRDIPLGVLHAGKAYELATTPESFEQTLLSGQFSLVREKAK